MPRPSGSSRRRAAAVVGGVAPLYCLYVVWALALSFADRCPTEDSPWVWALVLSAPSILGPMCYVPTLALLGFVVWAIYVVLTLCTRFGDLHWGLHTMIASAWYLAPLPLALKMFDRLAS